jgi:hypothetical protein
VFDENNICGEDDDDDNDDDKHDITAKVLEYVKLSMIELK